MDLQFVASGEDAVEYVFKTVSHATKPQHNLTVSSLQHHSSGFTAVKAAVDSYQPALAEVLMSSLRGPGLYIHALTNLTAPKHAPTFRICQEARGLSEVFELYFADTKLYFFTLDTRVHIGSD